MYTQEIVKYKNNERRYIKNKLLNRRRENQLQIWNSLKKKLTEKFNIEGEDSKSDHKK